MRTSSLLATCITFLLAPFASAATGPTCSLDVFKPSALLQELKVTLPESGIALVNLNKDPNATSSRLLLVRDDAIVGELYFSVDGAAQKSEITLLSAAADVLFHFEAATEPCKEGRVAGRCTRIEGYTELEAPLDGRPSYAVHARENGSLPTYRRYDTTVNRLEFRRALTESLDWLVSTLDATDVTRPVRDSVAIPFTPDLAFDLRHEGATPRFLLDRCL